jgi:UDP-N-acetylglucosamine 2-epimerase (non-hydrolysing)
MRKIHIAAIIGTRPEAIKLVPIILAARERSEQFHIKLVRTGQHRELVDQLMEEFGLQADVDLNVMQPNQDPIHVLIEGVRGLSTFVIREKPDWVLVQGDTMTTVAGALAGFYNHTRVGHVEAGLRTGDRSRPFPEEVNRSLAARLADVHFAPTEQARDNLLREGIACADILVTGNTVVDALLQALARKPVATECSAYILVTVHRRENHGVALHHICEGLVALLERHSDVHAIIPMHPHPSVRDVLMARVGRHPRIVLTEPLGYTEFIGTLNGAAMVLTDSGGVQEECAVLGKPMLILRENSERPEALDADTTFLVGTNSRRILEFGSRLLNWPLTNRENAPLANVFGDGNASTRILDALLARTFAGDGRQIIVANPKPSRILRVGPDK